MEDGGLFALARHAVLAQFGQQRIYLLIGLLDAVRPPHGHDHACKRLRILPRGGEAVLVVSLVQGFECALPFSGIFDKLDDGIFLVILRVQFRIDGGHTLCGGLDCVFIDGHVRAALSTRLRAGHFRFDLLCDSLEAVRVGWREVVLDLDSFTGVDEFLQPDLIRFREITVLTLLQKRFDFCVQRIQRFDVLGKLLRYAGIAALVSRSLEVGEFFPCAGGEGLEGIRPRGHDLVRFLLSVRPHLEQPVQPVLRALRLPGEVAFAHAEERQPLGSTVERLGGGVLPLLGRLIHGLQRFPRLFRARDVVHQRSGSGHHSGSHGQPHGGGFGQRRKEALPAAARLAHGGGKLADAGGQCAHTFGDFPQHQQHRPSGGSISCHAHDLLALAFVQLHEFVQQVCCPVDEVLYGGVEVVADLLRGQQRGVFEVGEAALCGGVAFVGFIGEGSIFLPRGRRRFLCARKQFGGVGGAHEGVAQAHFCQAHLLQGHDGRHALLVHFGQAHDERLDRSGGVGVPHGLKFLCCHARDVGKILERIVAGLNGHLHLDHGLREGGATRLGLQADRRQRRGKAQYLRLRQAHLRARRAQPRRHVHNGALGGGEIVAQVHQCRAETPEVALRHLRDVGKLRNGSRGFVGHDVGGIAQVDHGAGEVYQIVVLDAQLSGVRHYLGNVTGGGSDLGGHPLDRI